MTGLKEKRVLFFDDTVDIGKEPLPMVDEEAIRIKERFLEKYNIKKISGKDLEFTDKIKKML